MAQNIYQSPVVLSSTVHRTVKVAPISDFAFARGLNSVMIVGQEFLEAAKFYPVAFTKAKDQEIIPVALLGFRNNENLFVDSNNAWCEGMYVPAFFRRYPFVLASNAGQDGSFAVCIDSSYEGFGKENGMALFDDHGNQTPEFNKVIEFLKSYHTQYESTKAFVKLLNEYGLFKDFAANITLPAGEKFGLTGLMMVNEEAIVKLADDKIVHLVKLGYLALVYAHLYSLSNFRGMIARATRVAG